MNYCEGKDGIVYILGAGPGDFRLLTRWGEEILKKADIIYYDRLVNPSTLSLVKESSKLIYVGKAPANHRYSQKEINQMLIDSARSGKVVVRLKGGDPYIFGRGGEEASQLEKAGIEFKVIPGISSVMAAASYAGIPITNRGLSSSFHVFSGHNINKLDFDKIKKLQGTILFVMGLRNLKKIADSLITAGLSPATPIAVVYYGTTAAQQVIKAHLQSIYSQVKNSEITPPALIIIGDVVQLSRKLNWFNKGILAGKRILVTRSYEQQFELGRKIEKFGGEPLYLPTIKIKGPLITKKSKKLFSGLKRYDWIILTSTNAVKYFFKLMKSLKIDIRSLYDKHFAVVGSATEDALRNKGIYSDLVPENYSTYNLAQIFVKKVKSPMNILLPGSKLANRELDSFLKKAGHRVDRIDIYTTVKNNIKYKTYKQILQERPLDLITFTSPSTAENLQDIVNNKSDKIYKTPVVCIGPVTAQKASELGFNVIGIAKNYNINGLVNSIKDIYQENK